MRVPFTINKNVFEQYKASKATLGLASEARRTLRPEDPNWDDYLPLKLTELCLQVIVANFENKIILNEVPCWDRNLLLEMLPTDLSLPLAVKHINDQIYWKRRVKDRWKDEANYVEFYGFDWKRMYLERHLQEAVEIMTPEGFDPKVVEALCTLTRSYVKVLNLRELQILQPNIAPEDDEDFSTVPEPCDHIDLCPIIVGLTNLLELHIQFGLRNVGSDYKKSFFQFSLQDCRNLGNGIAKTKSLKLLRIHSCTLDDDKVIVLLSTMADNNTIEELDFSNCLLGNDGATAVAKYLKTHKITALNLSNNHIKSEGIASLSFVVTQHYAAPLEKINLKFNAFGNDGCTFLTSALIRRHTKLKVINISCCNLSEKSGIMMAEVLRRNELIKEIDFSNNHLGPNAGIALRKAVENNIHIHRLDLRMTEINNDDMLKINQLLRYNRIRAVSGEQGLEKKKRLIEKRAEKEQNLAAEQESAKRPEEEEVASSRKSIA